MQRWLAQLILLGVILTGALLVSSKAINPTSQTTNSRDVPEMKDILSDNQEACFRQMDVAVADWGSVQNQP